MDISVKFREAGLTEGGVRTFLCLWLGETVSLVGTHLTGFALGVFIFQATNSVSEFVLISVASIVPEILLGPLAGSFVDRWGARRMMLVGDGGAALASLLIGLAYWLGVLETWTAVTCVALASTFSACQYPAFSTITTALVPAGSLGRANGLVEFGFALAYLFAPGLGALLLKRIELGGIILVDVATALWAIFTLCVLPLLASARSETESFSIREDFLTSLQFIHEHPGLRMLALLLAWTNMSFGMIEVLMTPLVLGFADVDGLALILTLGGIGMLAGSWTMTVWGGPRRRALGVLWFLGLQGVLLFVAVLRPSVLWFAASAFGVSFTFPIVTACDRSIWQTEAPPHARGRILAAQRTLTWGGMPVGYLLAGPLADYVFEPAMASGGSLANSVGYWLGIGPGRGVALMAALLATVTVFAVGLASTSSAVRRAGQKETETALSRRTSRGEVSNR